MTLSPELAGRIVKAAHSYLGRPYDWHTFDCVHFVFRVYEDAGIIIPRFGSRGFPPKEYHLTSFKFAEMPLGHSVFFKRKEKITDRVWTHVGIIISSHEIIHCSRHCGGCVTITPKVEFLEMYDLAPSLS